MPMKIIWLKFRLRYHNDLVFSYALKNMLMYFQPFVVLFAPVQNFCSVYAFKNIFCKTLKLEAEKLVFFGHVL